MSAPSIVSSSPSSGTTDVVLGTKIRIGFDQAIDTSTLNSATFSLTGPGQTAVVSPRNLIASTPTSTVGREYIPGAFSFSTDGNGFTIAVFTPSVPLQPEQVYTIQIIGPATLTSASVKNSAGEALAAVYKWSFTTGALNTVTPPPSSPLPQISIPLDPSQVRISQVTYATGNDLSQEITVSFPAAIDPASFSVSDVLLSVEALLNDPSVEVPAGLTTSATVTANKIVILISGWPAS